MQASFVATMALAIVGALAAAQPVDAACVLPEPTLDLLTAQWAKASPDDVLVPCIQSALANRTEKPAGCRTYEEVTEVLENAFRGCLALERAGKLPKLAPPT